MAPRMGSDRVPDVSFHFDHDSRAPSAARKALSPLLGPDDPLTAPVTLSASELISNVVMHTDDGGEMRVWDPKPDVPLRLEIEDHELATPTAQPYEAQRIGGRGISIVERLADAWGTLRTAAGKVVWAEFDRSKR